MDRQIVQPSAIPLETDLLHTNKYAMIGLAKACAAILGTSTLINGLACTPNSPAALNVLIAPGEIYSLANIDGTTFGSLAADTTHSILKQGLSLDTVTLSTPAPATAGQSVNYLVQVAYQDLDADPVVLPYYNASNPAQAYSGPNNTGVAQNTTRKGVCVVAIKAGIAAATGAQTTPTPDVGYTGAFVVTVANGATTVVSGNISTYSGAPFITETLTQKISQATADTRYMRQGSELITATAGGTADALTAAFNPPIAALNNQTVYIKASAPNATTTPTLNPGSGVIPVVKGNNLPLAVGDIFGWMEIKLDATLGKAVLLNPATGVTPPVTFDEIKPCAATVAGNALTATLNPTTLEFRSATLSSGAVNTRTVASPVSVVAPSGASLGTSSGVTAVIDVLALDNAGTVETALIYQNGANLLDETGLISTTAISAGATSANVAYSTTARTNVPYRIVERIESTQATAGTWTTAPSKVQGAGGMAITAGKVAQTVSVVTGAYSSGPTTIPLDDTIPQNTEGDQCMSATIIPTRIGAKIKVKARGLVSNSAGYAVIMALFRDSVADALSTSLCSSGASSPISLGRVDFEMIATSLTPIVFKVRIGASAASTTYFNGNTGRYFGGVADSGIEITEYLP